LHVREKASGRIETDEKQKKKGDETGMSGGEGTHLGIPSPSYAFVDTHPVGHHPPSSTFVDTHLVGYHPLPPPMSSVLCPFCLFYTVLCPSCPFYTVFYPIIDEAIITKSGSCSLA